MNLLFVIQINLLLDRFNIIHFLLQIKHTSALKFDRLHAIQKQNVKVSTFNLYLK